MTTDLNWDKTKIYKSPSGDTLAMYEEGEWRVYTANRVIAETINEMFVFIQPSVSKVESQLQIKTTLNEFTKRFL